MSDAVVRGATLPTGRIYRPSRRVQYSSGEGRDLAVLPEERRNGPAQGRRGGDEAAMRTKGRSDVDDRKVRTEK